MGASYPVVPPSVRPGDDPEQCAPAQSITGAVRGPGRRRHFSRTATSLSRQPSSVRSTANAHRPPYTRSGEADPPADEQVLPHGRRPQMLREPPGHLPGAPLDPAGRAVVHPSLRREQPSVRLPVTVVHGHRVLGDEPADGRPVPHGRELRTLRHRLGAGRATGGAKGRARIFAGLRARRGRGWVP
ncbi:hypothetical protein GCM10010266_18310 [Streptomyces griseomycini]|nr:hypothetical protein GCM10010266_18310 [Streptomyces griseomycini]